MEDDPEEPRPISPAKMSKVPSWVSVGIVLGVLVGWSARSWFEPAKKPATMEVRMTEVPRLEPQPTKLTTVEALFETWGEHAVWDRGTTEFACWNPGTQLFSEFYEVRRVGGESYFRSIPVLTRRMIRHGKPLPAECPLEFTETEEQYRDWRENGRVERPAAQTFAPARGAGVPAVPAPKVEPGTIKAEPPPVEIPRGPEKPAGKPDK